MRLAMQGATPLGNVRASCRDPRSYKGKKRKRRRKPAFCMARIAKTSVLEVLAQALQRLQLHGARPAWPAPRRLPSSRPVGQRRSASSLAARTAASSMSCARITVSASTVTTSAALRECRRRSRSPAPRRWLGHHDLAGLQAGDQRGVTRRDAEFALFAGGDDQVGLAVVDLGFGADDVATEWWPCAIPVGGSGPGPTALLVTSGALRRLISQWWAKTHLGRLTPPSCWPSPPPPRCRRPCRRPAPAGGRIRRRRSP